MHDQIWLLAWTSPLRPAKGSGSACKAQPYKYATSGYERHNLPDPASTKWAKRMCFQMPQGWGQSSASADVRQQGQWDRNSQHFPQALSVRMRSNGPEVTAWVQSRRGCPIPSEKPVIFGLKGTIGALIKLYCVYSLSWKSLPSRLRGTGGER